VSRLDHVVLHVTAYPVLWTKQRCEIDRRMIEQEICRVAERVIDRSLIADKRYPGALHCDHAIAEQPFEAKFDLMSAVRHLSNQ